MFTAAEELGFKSSPATRQMDQSKPAAAPTMDASNSTQEQEIKEPIVPSALLSPAPSLPPLVLGEAYTGSTTTQRLVINLWKLHCAKVLTDVDLVLEDVEEGESVLATHGLLLCAMSPLFETKLTSEEFADVSRPRIPIKGVGLETMKMLLDVTFGVQSERVYEIESVRQIRDLWTAAHTLQVEVVEKMCSRWVTQAMQIETCVAVFQGLDAFHRDKSAPGPDTWRELEGAQIASLRFLLDNFEAVSKSTGFLELTQANMVKILQTLTSPNLKGPVDEQVAYEATLRWLTAPGKDRVEACGDVVLPYVMFRSPGDKIFWSLTHNYIKPLVNILNGVSQELDATLQSKPNLVSSKTSTVQSGASSSSPAPPATASARQPTADDDGQKRNTPQADSGVDAPNQNDGVGLGSQEERNGDAEKKITESDPIESKGSPPEKISSNEGPPPQRKSIPMWTSNLG